MVDITQLLEDRDAYKKEATFYRAQHAAVAKELKDLMDRLKEDAKNVRRNLRA